MARRDKFWQNKRGQTSAGVTNFGTNQYNEGIKVNRGDKLWQKSDQKWRKWQIWQNYQGTNFVRGDKLPQTLKFSD